MLSISSPSTVFSRKLTSILFSKNAGRVINDTNTARSVCALKSSLSVPFLQKPSNFLSQQVRSSTVHVRPSPTMIPTKEPIEIHRAAIEKAMSKEVAPGRKHMDISLIRPVTPAWKVTPQAWVKNTENEHSELIDLNPYFFDCTPKKHILHMMVVWQLAKRRQGTHKTKYRHETAFTTRKIYRQKRTGRARHGDKGAHIFLKGGNAFPKRPKDYSFKLNKRVRRLALRMALTTKYLQNKLLIIDDIQIPEAKTKQVQAIYDKLGIQTKGGALLVGGEKLDENFVRATFNISHVDVLPTQGINVYDILRKDRLILTKSCLQQLDKRFEKYIPLNE